MICDLSGQQHWFTSPSQQCHNELSGGGGDHNISSSSYAPENHWHYPADNTTFDGGGGGATHKNCNYFDQIDKFDTITHNTIDDNHNNIGGGGGGMNNNVSPGGSSIRDPIHSQQTIFAQTACSPSPNPVSILFLTLLMTSSATAMLCAAIMTNNWELVTWDTKLLRKLVNDTATISGRTGTRQTITIEWMIGDKVARIPPGK